MDRKWWTLLASCIAIFMLLLDVTIVNVALPSIERDLGADFSDLQRVIDAYALTLAGFVLAAGSLARSFRRSGDHAGTLSSDCRARALDVEAGVLVVVHQSPSKVDRFLLGQVARGDFGFECVP